MRPNSAPETSAATQSGRPPAAPPVAPSAYELADSPTPITSGPSVSAAQYTRMRCANGRGRRTRQIALSERSIVSIVDSALAASTTAPAPPRPRALSAKSASAPSTGRAIASGTSACRK